jgi:general stress protein 26
MHAEHSPDSDIRDLGKLIQKIRIAMLTTRSAEGRLVSRPLYTKEIEFDGDLWFFTGLDTNKVHQLVADPQVNVAYSEPSDQIFVSIDGRAEVVRDPGKISELWNETDSLYFKQGKSDPNLVLLRIRAETAESWTSASTAIGRAFKFLKARATGDVSDLGEHKHVELT